jgi:hypothetical protein
MFAKFWTTISVALTMTLDWMNAFKMSPNRTIKSYESKSGVEDKLIFH